MNVTTGLKVTTPSDLEIVMTRAFNAPRRLVWDAITKPEFVRRWLFAPPGWAMTVCEGDLRVGGKFRWQWSGPDGKLAMTISGVNKEVSPPAKLIHTELMEMGPGAGPCGGGDGGGGDCTGDPWELLCTIELTEHGGRTHLKMTLLFPTKEGRDGALASGMEQGVSAGYDTLDRLLVEIAR